MVRHSENVKAKQRTPPTEGLGRLNVGSRAEGRCLPDRR